MKYMISWIKGARPVGLTLLCLTIAGPLAPEGASAQTIRGTVLDEERLTGVPDAVVRFVTSEGSDGGRTVADGRGRFVLTPFRPGEYYLVAERIGYQRFRSPLLAIANAGTFEMDLLMAPDPVELGGVSVTVASMFEAEQSLRMVGIHPEDLGRRWITPADIEKINVKRDVGNILEWQGINGIRVIRPENLVPGSANLGLCVSLVRARTFEGKGRCALLVVDGQRVGPIQALYLNPEIISAIAVLQPMEATVVFGVAGEAGAVMFWTNKGGR